MIKKLHSYIIKEFLGSFLFGVTVFSILFILDYVFDLADLFLSKGVSVFLVLKLFVFILPNILRLAIPMAMLFGILIAYGKLSENNEITAMKSLGINYKILSLPTIILTCIISLSLLFFNHFLSPTMNSNFRNLYQEILTKRPLIKFTEKTIVKLGEYRLYANKIDRKNNILYEVNIYKLENKNDHYYGYTDEKKDKEGFFLQNNSKIWRIAASSAKVKFYQNGTQFFIYDGYWQKANLSDINNMTHMTFKSYCFFLPLPEIIKEQTISISEMSSPEILKTIKTCKEQGILFTAGEIEFWIRWVYALSPISFALIALPIGIMAGKRGKTIGFGMSLGIILVYYTLLILVLTLSEKDYAPANLVMWLPNVVIAAAGICLFTKMVKK
jgi:lipopolysaccharide export LptBFGC system permease protein LptF